MVERTYEVRVSGLVPTKDLLDELGDVEIAEHEVRTVFSGRFRDQAALYGFLHRLRAYGLEVVEVRRVPAPADEAQDTERLHAPEVPAPRMPSEDSSETGAEADAEAGRRTTEGVDS
jgi:hypothetical protein